MYVLLLRWEERERVESEWDRFLFSQRGSSSSLLILIRVHMRVQQVNTTLTERERGGSESTRTPLFPMPHHDHPIVVGEESVEGVGREEGVGHSLCQGMHARRSTRCFGGGGGGGS